jgi:hypothetical protein
VDYVAEFCDDVQVVVMDTAVQQDKQITFQTNLDAATIRDIANAFNAATESEFFDMHAAFTILAKQGPLDGSEPSLYGPGTRNFINRAIFNGADCVIA